MTRWRPYAKYKPSGIEWLGEIPEHWEVCKLKHVASIQFSNVDKNKVEDEEPVRLCNYVDVYYNDFITSELEFMEATATVGEIRKFMLRNGDMLVTKDSEAWDDIAVPAYVVDNHDRILCGYHLAQIRPNPSRIDGKYLFRSFCARGINDQFRVAATGITRYGLSKYWIDNGLFPVPPVDEQRAIAAFLDRETARIDELIKKKERQIELLQEKRTALISHAVTKGLNPNVKMKDSGIEWLGEIPEHWEIIPLRWYLRIGSGSFLSNTEFVAEPMEGLDIPVIGGNGIMGFTDKANIGKTTIAIGRVGVYCGNVHFVKAPAWVTDNALMLSGIRAFEVEYLSLLLKVLNLNRLANQNTQPLVTGTMVKGQRVPLPPISEQRAIAAFLDRETARIDALIEKIRKSIDLLREYRTALITAAVTGKIDVRLAAAENTAQAGEEAA